MKAAAEADAVEKSGGNELSKALAKSNAMKAKEEASKAEGQAIVKSEIVAKAKEEERQKKEALANTDAPMKPIVIADNIPPSAVKKTVPAPEEKLTKPEEASKPIIV